jgi:hypothetical protein
MRILIGSASKSLSASKTGADLSAARPLARIIRAIRRTIDSKTTVPPPACQVLPGVGRVMIVEAVDLGGVGEEQRLLFVAVSSATICA